MSNILQRDIKASGTMSALNDVVSLNINAKSNTNIHLSYSAFVGTAIFEATTDGTNWENVYALLSGTGTSVKSANEAVITSGGNIFKLVSAGYVTVRVRISAYTSGSLDADIVASPFASGVELIKPLPTGSNVIGKVDNNTVIVDEDFNTTLDSTQWTSVTGTGTSITQPTSTLRLTAGTTAGAVCSVTSVKPLIGEFKFTVQALLSQRIINQNIYIELVNEVGTTLIQWDFNGTTVTSASTRTLVNSIGRFTASNTINTSNSLQKFTILRTQEGVQFLTCLTESNTADTIRATYTYGGIPPLDKPLYIRFRTVNGGTAPASSTNLDIERVVVLAQDSTRVKILGSENNSSILNSFPVTVLNTTTISGTVTANQGTALAATSYALNSAASTNGALVAATNKKLYAGVAFNNGAGTAYLKFYNKATAPTVGTDVPVMVIPIPAGQQINIEYGTYGCNFVSGLGIAITGGSADNDTTAVAASQVKVQLTYI